MKTPAPTVYILIGKIASGKTHYANALFNEKNIVPLSCDELILAMFTECLGGMHDEMTRRASEFLFSQAQKLHKAGVGSSLDFGFWTKSQRARAYEYFSSRGINTVRIYFDPPEKTRLDRLYKRNARLSALGGDAGRQYIIDDELRCRLDAKFMLPGDGEYDILITD